MRSSTPWAHTIHINLNMIFYTHVEHSPTKTIYIKYYTHTHTHKNNNTTNMYTHTHSLSHTHTHTHTHTHNDCSRNWVLILVRIEILREEEGFQFGFKRWQGWAVSKVLWEWIPNLGSKARDGAKAMSVCGVSLCVCVCFCVSVVCVTVCVCVCVCPCEEVSVSVQVSVCNHTVGGCVWNALVLMYVFTVLFCAFLIVVTVLVLFLIVMLILIYIICIIL